MPKRFLTLLAAVALVAGMHTFADYERTRTYTEGQFADVNENEWYSSEVRIAYEIGLMQGVSTELFSPDEPVSVAECITMASRLHAVFNGSEIPGVMAEDAYHDAVLLLYRAGILCGNDAYGFFAPETGLKRCEAAAIVNRIALPENRKTFGLTPVREAFYLTDDQTMTQSMRNVKRLTSSWNYENRFDTAVNTDNTTTPTLSDGSTVGYSSINRAIEPQNSGVFTFETEVELYGGINGARIYFENTDGENVFELYTKDGFFRVKAKEDKPTALAVNSKTYYFRVTIDLDDRSGVLSADGEKTAEFSLPDDYGNIGKLVFSTPAVSCQRR